MALRAPSMLTMLLIAFATTSVSAVTTPQLRPRPQLDDDRYADLTVDADVGAPSQAWIERAFLLDVPGARNLRQENPAANDDTSSPVPTLVIGVLALIAGVICIVAAVALYRRRQALKALDEYDLSTPVSTPSSSSPAATATPTTSAC